MLFVKHGIKNSETTSSLSDLYSCFNDRSRNVNRVKVTWNYLSKPIKNKNAPAGIRTRDHWLEKPVCLAGLHHRSLKKSESITI